MRGRTCCPTTLTFHQFTMSEMLGLLLLSPVKKSRVFSSKKKAKVAETQGKLVLATPEAIEVAMVILSPVDPFHHVDPKENLVVSLKKMLAGMTRAL